MLHCVCSVCCCALGGFSRARVLCVVLFFFLGGLFWVLFCYGFLLFCELFSLLFGPGCWASCCSFFSAGFFGCSFAWVSFVLLPFLVTFWPWSAGRRCCSLAGFFGCSFPWVSCCALSGASFVTFWCWAAAESRGETEEERGETFERGFRVLRETERDFLSPWEEERSAAPFSRRERERGRRERSFF